jgi:hypothetical protein
MSVKVRETGDAAKMLRETVLRTPAGGRRQRAVTLERGDFTMPSTVNLNLIGVWFCVGFFTGAGWAVAAWLIGRVLGRLI